MAYSINHRDVLVNIFINCIDQGRNIVLVCKDWDTIFRYLIEKSPLAGAIIEQMSRPETLHPVCFSRFTLEQKANLPRYIRQWTEITDLRDIYLRGKYKITWRDIMNYCKEKKNVDWMLSSLVASANSMGNIYKALFIDFDQFREYIYSCDSRPKFHALYTTCLSINTSATSINIRIHIGLIDELYNLFIDSSHIYGELLSDLLLIDYNNMKITEHQYHWKVAMFGLPVAFAWREPTDNVLEVIRNHPSYWKK